jgi:hypothetical protein
MVNLARPRGLPFQRALVSPSLPSIIIRLILKVVFAVKQVRQMYPSSSGQYMGFKAGKRKGEFEDKKKKK